MNKSLLKITKSVLMTILLMNAIPTLSHAGSWNGWIYQNPYPTSNTLLAVKFITPQKGWVAGEQGTILHTEDGGETWEIQESGTEQSITSIAFVNEKVGWAVIGREGTIIHTEDGGMTWTKQTQINAVIKSINIINEKEGWAVGGLSERTEKDTIVKGVVLHTTDGGRTWKTENTGINHAMVSVHFINSQTGWILGEDKIYRTKNGGKTWEKSNLPQDDFPIFGVPGHGQVLSMTNWDRGEVTFADEKNGWIVIGFSLIFHSADGGKTWKNQRRTGSMDYTFDHISFSDPKTGCVAGSHILCTDNGGKTWSERLKTPMGSGTLNGISFTRRAIGWAVGDNGQIWKTEETGKSWKSASRDECGGYTFFVNKEIGWLHGSGSRHICRTDDGGHTWTKQEVGIGVWGLFFTDASTGWAVGTIKERNQQNKLEKVYGVIRYTNDGGKTWITQYRELMNRDWTVAGLTTVLFVNENEGWAGGQQGLILHTVNGEGHWEKQKTGNYNLTWARIYFSNKKIGWIVGTKITEDWTGIILYTEDGGKNWQPQYNLKYVGLTGLFFTDEKTGWVTGLSEDGGNGWLLYTVTGGAKWTKTEFGDIGYSDPAFLDNQRGVISSPMGWIFTTTDGGKTWDKKRKPLRKHPWHFSEIFEKTQSGK